MLRPPKVTSHSQSRGDSQCVFLCRKPSRVRIRAKKSSRTHHFGTANRIHPRDPHAPTHCSAPKPVSTHIPLRHRVELSHAHPFHPCHQSTTNPSLPNFTCQLNSYPQDVELTDERLTGSQKLAAGRHDQVHIETRRVRCEVRQRLRYQLHLAHQLVD